MFIRYFSSGLSFSWACEVISGSDFGSSCGEPSVIAPGAASKVQVVGSSLDVDTTYKYTVLVTSKPFDGRSATASVTVDAVAGKAPQVTIVVPTALKFNPTESLSLSGSVNTTSSCTASWKVVGWSDATLQNASVVPTSQVVTVAVPGTSKLYSSFLGISANTFVPGVSYVFSLYATPIGASAKSVRITQKKITHIFAITVYFVINTVT